MSEAARAHARVPGGDHVLVARVDGRVVRAAVDVRPDHVRAAEAGAATARARHPHAALGLPGDVDALVVDVDPVRRGAVVADAAGALAADVAQGPGRAAVAGRQDLGLPAEVRARAVLARHLELAAEDDPGHAVVGGDPRHARVVPVLGVVVDPPRRLDRPAGVRRAANHDVQPVGQPGPVDGVAVDGEVVVAAAVDAVDEVARDGDLLHAGKRPAAVTAACRPHTVLVVDERDEHVVAVGRESDVPGAAARRAGSRHHGLGERPAPVVAGGHDRVLLRRPVGALDPGHVDVLARHRDIRVLGRDRAAALQPLPRADLGPGGRDPLQRHAAPLLGIRDERGVAVAGDRGRIRARFRSQRRQGGCLAQDGRPQIGERRRRKQERREKDEGEPDEEHCGALSSRDLAAELPKPCRPP